MAFLFRSLVVFLFAAAVASGCGGSGGGSAPGPGPTPVTVTGVTVSGGGSPVVGDTVQFTATATFSDGTTQTVTGQVTWESSNTAIVTITAGGLATFLAAGDAEIKATYRSSSGTTVSSTSRVTATPKPPSRYTLSGTVSDVANGSMMSGVDARIIDGPDASRTAVTDGAGRFSISNVNAGSFQVQFTRKDYVTQSIPVSLTGDMSMTVRLAAQPPAPPDVTRFYGTYNTALTMTQQTCPGATFEVGKTGTFKIEGNSSGSSMKVTIVERGTTRTYSGSMRADGSFSGNADQNIIAGFTPPQNKHEYTGSVSGASNGTRVDATEFVNFTVPCPGGKMQIVYSGSK
jgi:hypothetical protein